MRMRKILLPCLLTAGLLLVSHEVGGRPEGKPPSPGQFDREQLMLINLNHGRGSTVFYLLEAMRKVKDLNYDVERALKQAEEVDKTFARSRGRPDDKFLELATARMANARKRGAEMEEEIHQAHKQLKEEIKQALLIQ